VRQFARPMIVTRSFAFHVSCAEVQPAAHDLQGIFPHFSGATISGERPHLSAVAIRLKRDRSGCARAFFRSLFTKFRGWRTVLVRVSSSTRWDCPWARCSRIVAAYHSKAWQHPACPSNDILPEASEWAAPVCRPGRAVCWMASSR